MARYALGAEEEGRADSHLANGAAAPYGDRVAALDVAELGGHVAGGEDVGEEERLFVAQPVGHLDRADIGIRHAQIFGLAAAVATQQMRIAKEAGRRIAPKLGGLLAIGIAAFAAGIKSPLAEETLAAGDCEGHDDAIADLQGRVLAAHFDDLSHGLVSDDVTGMHVRDRALVDVKIRAANRAGRHLDDGVTTILDDRVGDAFAADVVLAMPGEGLHSTSPWSGRLRGIGGGCCLVLFPRTGRARGALRLHPQRFAVRSVSSRIRNCRVTAGRFSPSQSAMAISCSRMPRQTSAVSMSPTASAAATRLL